MRLEMYKNIITLLFILQSLRAQILRFGKCVDVKTMDYFQIDKFLGKWYIIEEFPVWYEENGHCAYKVFDLCGRRVTIQNGYVRNNIEYVLHINSSYSSGDEAVFNIEKNNIDPVGMPLSVISTDYTNYSLLYGCRLNDNLQLKYITCEMPPPSKCRPGWRMRSAPGDTLTGTFQATEPGTYNNNNKVEPLCSPITSEFSCCAWKSGIRIHADVDRGISAWILSRNVTLSADILEIAYRELNSLPDASSGYLKSVNHSESMCTYQWTADVHAVNTNSIKDFDN